MEYLKVNLEQNTTEYEGLPVQKRKMLFHPQLDMALIGLSKQKDLNHLMGI